MFPPPPSSPLFPYTTLFRSSTARQRRGFHHHVDSHVVVAMAIEEQARVLDDTCTCFRLVFRSIGQGDRKSTRLNSSHTVISYAVFCLKKKKKNIHNERLIHD